MNKKILLVIIATSLVVGLGDTVFISPENVGSWENYAGYLFLAIAAVNSYFLIRKNFIKRKREYL